MTQQYAPPAGTQPIASGINGSKALFLATALIGVVNLFLGFTTISTNRLTSLSFFSSGGFLGWVPALLFLGGLAAARAVLPGERRDVSLPALVTAAVVVPFLFIVLAIDHGDDGLSTGEILYLIFGPIQLILAVGAVVLDSFQSGRFVVQRMPQHPHHPPQAPVPGNDA